MKDADNHNFFKSNLSQVDEQVFSFINQELHRQQDGIELIASENIVSRAVLEAQGSILTNKYAEGYPGRRYYGGCEFVDEIEKIAIDRAKLLFNASFANVQPHSGSQANQAVLCALLEPYDKILGLSLDSGGHLTHGAKVNLSGKWFQASSYDVTKDSGYIDYEQMQELANTHHPKLIIAGCSAYPRFIDFKKCRAIADQVGAYLMVDMAHFAGQVAAGLYQNPLEFAHIVTTTTHKTLRGPRGGMILTNHEEIAKKINSGVFPGIQGGPLMHVIAAKAVAFKEASTPQYKSYMQQVINNAKVLAEILIERGYKIFTNGTDCHLLLVDLREQNITGKAAQASLENANMTCNKNAIPFDLAKPTITSGIRLGTPAATTRGFKEAEFIEIAHLIANVLDGLTTHHDDNSIAESQARVAVRNLCAKFPIY